MNDKFLPAHLERKAYVYVRQSTLHQVRHHLDGQQRQYSLADRAREVGFSQVVTIDDDLGVSGSGKQERPGFARLLAAVCQGEVGAVFALEASRLARNNRDWHHLIDLCAMTDTLIVDHDGIYDPRLVNDRLLLGLKGTMSEFELSLFRQRARGALEQKIRRGHALWELPVGFVRTEDNQVQKSPDRQVQQAIDMVFDKFRELGSARQTMLYFRDENISLPEVVRGTDGVEIVWRLPCQSRVQQVLRNPCYAGALVYGRTANRPIAVDKRPRCVLRGKQPMEKWKVLLRDHHEGYITWDQYLHNRSVLEANLARGDGQNAGAARGGAALLSGLLRCGICGRMFFVAYSGNGSKVPRYACHGGRVDRGSAACQSVGGLRVDRAVAELVLEAIQPAGIEAARAAMNRAIDEDAEKRRALELALEKARYEVKRAQRQFDLVDPENRLVASELEARWNEAIGRVRDLEGRLGAERERAQPLNEQQERRLQELGSDLQFVWHHLDTSMELKKRILRTVVEEIVVRRDDDHQQHILTVHWKGGVHSELRVKRNGTGQHSRVADDKAVELIEELSKICDDQTIAQVLNRLGYRTGQGKTWRVHHVHGVRHTRGLTNYKRTGDWLSLEEAARTLDVSNTVVKRLIQDRLLPAKQVVPCAPWVIERASLELPAVQHRVGAVHEGRKLSPPVPGQQELPLK
jgi:DNA invertase Pin-like site-specific DNA recombinase